ncbi:cupin domain-containing protein [Parasedimentitalea huanghaiensis]|uniref:Cupin domain-containing protein n=1 Tax=Parasedimentitalea huanghaiensis TaxID=2682100 RepID=A0A6L6WK88_9RHOB|nr:cupin domain-containing protein [Zongyanglinia huanghaiensis]MVO18084.1 cupin domain-containing protein [Zongyanglinia huanghaiensis]
MKNPIVPTDPGVRRQVLAENADLMLVAFRFETGAKGKLHSHPHVQATYVKSGRFAFSIDGTEHDLGAGDSLIIPSQARHGCVCIEAGTLIDTFTPRRADFL